MIAVYRAYAQEHNLPWIEPNPHEVPVCELRRDTLIYVCPGCREYHGVQVGREASQSPMVWKWNGSVIRPTLEPSILDRPLCDTPRCHHFLRLGVVEVCHDCGHSAKGQKLPLALYEP